MSQQPRAPRASGWQPIGLATPLTTHDNPGVVVRDLSVARARRTVRSLIAPGVVLAATLGVAGTAAAHDGTLHTPDGDIPVASATAAQIDQYGASSGVTTTSASTSSTGSPLSGLGGGELPGADLPVVGSFIANAPKIFSGGLLGGEDAIQTSVPRPEHTTGEHTQGGDACDFFLDHMWKNEDGLPVIGTNTHFLTYHTDAEYQNLILSLASGAIGNSQMPIVDIYGGPLGWIPIFNPAHVEGHGTDYVTMLTGCGGMGLPVDLKTGEVNLDRIPTPEKVLAFAQEILPTVPDPQKILAPDYLYNTLAVDEITNRLGFNTVFTPEEYLHFATNNFDAFRLLWGTALEKLDSGDPTAVLDILQVTDNLKTLQSLGLPGLPGTEGDTLTNSLPTSGLTSTLPTGDLVAGLPTSDVPLVGPLLADLLGGTSEPGTPGTTPGSSTPGESPDSPTSSLPLVGSLLGGDSPLGSLTGILGGSSSTPGSSTPGSSTPGSSTPGSTKPAPSDSPTSGLPVVGGLLGGSSPTGGIPVLGGILSGTSTTPGTSTSGTSKPGSTAPGSTTPGSTAPGTSTGGSTPSAPSGSATAGLPIVGDLLGGGLLGGTSTKPTQPSQPGTQPGSTTHGSTGSTPGTTTPGTGGSTSVRPQGDLLSSLPVVGGLLGTTGTTPTDKPAPTPTDKPTPAPTDQPAPTPNPTPTHPGGGSSPVDSPAGTVAFDLGGTKVNGQTSPTVPVGQQVTYTLPVTNTGDLPITTLVGKASDGGTMTGAKLPLAPGQTTTLTYTTTAKPGTQSVSFGVVASNPNGQQQGKSCSAVYTGDVKNGQIAKTGAIEVDDQPASDSVRYTFHSTDVSKLDVQVTNNGGAPLRNITASSPTGPVTGGTTTLQPGESTWFSVQVQPKSGINTVPVTFTGTDPTGKVTTAQEKFEYTLCTCTSTPAPQA